MALNDSLSTNDYDGRYYRLSWTATQSVANNVSTVSWTVEALGGPVWVAERTLKVVIAGKPVINKTDRVERYAGVILSGTITVPHDGNGAASFSASIDAAVYYSNVNCTASKTFTLDTIPRASTISVGTLTLGAASTITIAKANSNFTHTITYLWGDTTDSGISNGKGYKGTIASKTSNTSVSWTPSKDLANVIPNATSGAGSLICDTYSGSTKVGSSNITFTAKVPDDIKPTVDSTTITIDNSANSVIKEWGLYVAGYSKAKITATASGSYKSTISSFTIGGGYSTTQNGTSLNYTGAKFNSSGSKSFTVVAKDSRGRSSNSADVGSITVYAYSKPTISSFSVSRNSSDPTKIIVKANWSYATVNGKNTTTATLKYKKTSTTSWTTYGTIAKNTSTTLDAVFDQASGYNFQIVVTDSLSNSAEAEARISTAEVLLDFRAGGKGLGIGKIAETDALEVAMESKFSKDISIENECSILAYDSSGKEFNVFTGKSSNGNTIVGYGNFFNKEGSTHLYGNDVFVFSAASGVDTGIRPYYRAGDVISYSTLYTAGYVTNNKAYVQFSVPLSRPILGSPTITASSNPGLVIRQDGNYTHGSTSSAYVNPNSYTATNRGNYITITAEFTTTDNAVNNSACGVCWSGTITLS